MTRLNDGRIVELNKTTEEMFGYGREELLGSSSLSLNAWPNPEDRQQLINELRLKGSVKNREQVMRRRSGELFYTLFSAEVIEIGGEKIILSTWQDITERKKSEKLKDEFIGMISHELKTPMTVVIGALSTAVMPGVPEKVKADLFRDAVNHADILASIVDNLLELSRQQSNRLELRKKSTDIGLVACNVIDRFKKKSAIHELKCNFPEGLPRVMADPMRIERILYNLVENAVKYSPAGGEVKVFASVQEDFLKIGVADQGIGISAENLSRLFQPFERLGFDVKGAIQGTGLGLRVCRILAEAHGGKIWVESEPGKGSTFYFTLPLTNGGR